MKRNYLTTIYKTAVLKHPWIALLLVAMWVAFWGYHAGDFKLDASADSLVLEHDKDLQYYRHVRSQYGSNDFLIVTYTPRHDLFTADVLKDLKGLRDQLAAIDNITEVVSILDVPLINSPRPTSDELREGLPTLEDPGTQIMLARKELMESPLYKNNIISTDGRTTALQLTLRYDQTFYRLLHRRDELRDKEFESGLSRPERHELSRVSKEFEKHNIVFLKQQDRDVRKIRRIMANHEGMAELHLGGLPMITVDMVDFVRHDIAVFGAGVFLFILVILAVVFRRTRWVVLSLITCFSSILVMMGFLGFFDWPVTVVSSNFISLLLIITLSLTIHLIVRFRELRFHHGHTDQGLLVWETVRSKALPSFYTTITTMAAFGSLLVSGIRPVIDFGWMMVYGIATAFVLAFTLFPAGLALCRPACPIVRRDIAGKITGSFATCIAKNGTIVSVVYVAMIIFSVMGIRMLTVDNRFIDYFKHSTEIYRGMQLIDQKLGGTTPLDIVVSAPKDYLAMLEEETNGEFTDEFGDESESGLAGSSYWYNDLQLDLLYGIHDYLDQLPETGKVLSLATTMRLFEQLADSTLDNFELSILYNQLGQDIKAILLEPYLSDDGNETRFAVRLVDSKTVHHRNLLLEKIRRDLADKFGMPEDQFRVSGMGVLYNNVLQSLFRSQILTLGVVFMVIMLIFIALFRSLRIAVIGIIPNLIAAGLVLGTMGWLGIPLDIMTITIAAITIGIGVDDTIHYIHRFIAEFDNHGRDYWAAVRYCHGSIGLAMFYTTIIVTLGFSILVLSDFKPTIYFGLLTGFAMLTALIANLTLLPMLMVRFRALG